MFYSCIGSQYIQVCVFEKKTQIYVVHLKDFLQLAQNKQAVTAHCTDISIAMAQRAKTTNITVLIMHMQPPTTYCN